MSLSNAQLAQQLTVLVSLWNQRETEFRDWLGGTATGGPQGDGRFPLTNGQGVTALVACPASLASTVSGPGASATAAQLAAERARDHALAHRDEADQARILTQAALAAGVAARDLSIQYRDRSAAAEANAKVYMEAAQAAAAVLGQAGETAVAANIEAQAAKASAQASAQAAAASAVQAATFNPSLFVAASAFTWSNLGGKPATFAPAAHGHAVADVAGLQAALDAKLATSGFTWAALPGKPSTFAPAAHAHAIADVTGLQAALDAKQSSGSYVTTAGFNWTALADKPTSFASDWSTLAGKPATFAPSAHTHLIAEVSGLQSALDLRLPVAINGPGGAGTGVWQQASLAVDSAQGDGLLNIVGGAYHNRYANTSGVGHLYQGARGASRIGLHDNAINFYVGSKASSAGQVAGEAVSWINVAGFASTLSTFYSNVAFPTGLQVGNGVATGLYGDWNNIAVRGYASGNVYLQTQAGLTTNLLLEPSKNTVYLPTTFVGPANFSQPITAASSVSANGLTLATGSITLANSANAEQVVRGYMSDRQVYYYFNANHVGVYDSGPAGGAARGVWNYDKTSFNVDIQARLNAGAVVSGALTVTGGLTASGSVFVGNGGGVYVSGQTQCLQFDGSGGTRVSYRSGHATAVGVNLMTSDASLRGVLYSDGAGANMGFLNPSNGWRLRADASNLYVGDSQWTTWHAGNLSPATNNTGQVFPNSIVKEFQSRAGDILGSSVGQSYGGALGVVGPGQSDPYNQALMTFMRPGVFAGHFGLNSASRWVVGGFSYGNGVQKPLWLDGQIPTNTWQNTDDGKNRFWFSPNGDSIWKSSGYHYWRNANDGTVMTLSGNGELGVNSNVRASGTGGTGQFTAVINNTMAGFYQDGTQFYILKNATSSTSFDAHRPFYVNLSSGRVTLDGTGAGGVSVGGALTVVGTLYADGEIVTPGWIRVNGSNGLYWQNWGGGWYMSDATWMRSYNNKNIYTGGFVQADAGMTSQGGRVFHHADGAYANSSITYSTAAPSGGADGDVWFQYA